MKLFRIDTPIFLIRVTVNGKTYYGTRTKSWLAGIPEAVSGNYHLQKYLSFCPYFYSHIEGKKKLEKYIIFLAVGGCYFDFFWKM